MRPACLAKIELPQQKESHNKTYQQGSIAALFFLRVDEKKIIRTAPPPRQRVSLDTYTPSQTNQASGHTL